MSIGIITQVTDKIKSDFGASSRTGDLSKDFCERSQCASKFKVGDIATDGSFSCRRVVRIECLEDSFVYHFEGVLFGCPEESIRRPSETNQPLMPLDPPISAAKYKVGEVATVLIGSYLFACRRIVRVERYSFDSRFHYVFEGITGAFREGDVVLAEDTTPRMPHWDGVPGSLCSFRKTKCCTGDIANAKYKAGDIATVEINASSLFPPDMIVKIKSNDGAFHYFFEGHQCGYREENVVLAKIPLCPPLTRQKLTLATLHPTETLHDCRPLADFATNDTAKSLPSVTSQNHDNPHYQPVDCHSSSGTYSLSLPDSTRIVLCPEYESNEYWQKPPQYLDDFPDEADTQGLDFDVPLDEQVSLPVPDEPSEELLVAHGRRLALNYQHYGNSFGPQKSIDLCGAQSEPPSDDLIYWANLGARFVLLKNEHDAPHYKEPKQARKQPMGKDWQNRPHSASQAQEHLATGRGVGLLCGAYSSGLICLDIDELGVEKALLACPQLANMPYIAHSGKPGRAKYFFYAPEGTPNNSYGFKIDGKRVVFVEILSDGKAAVLPPSLHPCDARYMLFNQEIAVPTLTEDEINEMWQALVAVCPDNQSAKAKKAKREAKRAKRQAERQARRAKRTSALLFVGTDYDSFDWDAFTKEVADNFDLLAYAKANWNGQTQVEANGEIRIFGNGGLLINEDDGTWYCFSDQMGGGPFQLVAYNLTSRDDTSGNWGEILREAAEFAGVAWPVFKRSKRAKKQKHWLIPDAPAWVIEFCQNLKLDYAPITLHKEQQTYSLGKSYLSQVYDLNHLEAGQWLVQAPTERGKTTAIITQIQGSLIIAVPTQTQVDQITAEYNLAAIYQSIEPVFTGSVNRFVTTFDSVRKIVARAEKNDIDLSHWTLVIDECHQLAAADFRKKTGIEPLGACIPLFSRTIALSATPPPSVPFFENAPLIRFTAPQIMKPLYFATCSDYVNGIKQALGQASFVVCHHNDKIAIRAMIEELARDGIKALEFSSDSKEDDHHQNMIYTKNIPECDVLFVTSLYDDGLNFFCSQSYILLITAKSTCAPEQIEQISARIRKQRPKKTILIRKVTKSDKASDTPLAAKYQNFDYAATLNQKLVSALELAAVENEAYRKRLPILQRADPTASEEELITLARRQLASDGAYLGLKWDGTQYVTDRLGIHMSTYTQWGYACNANRDLMIRALKPYNFVYHGEWDVKELKSATRESKKRQALRRKELTEEKQQEVKGHLLEIKDFGHAEWILTNKGNEGHNVAEYHAATLMMELVDTGVTADCAKALILNSTLTGHAVTIIKGKIRLQQMRLGFEQVGRYLGADVGFYRKLYEIAQIGDLLTSEKLDEIFERIFADNEGIAPRMAYCSPNADKQKSKRIWLINRAFGTKRTKVTREYIDDEGNVKSKRVDVYQIVSLSPLELDFDIEPKIETANAAVSTKESATDSTNATDSFVQQTLFVDGVAQKPETVIDTANRATATHQGTLNENEEGNYDEVTLENGRELAIVDKFEYQPTESNPYGW